MIIELGVESMLKRDTRAQIIILQNGEYILLKHHGKEKNNYFWGLPGGGVEAGETVEEAAVREAYEETGLKVKLLPFSFEKQQDDDLVYKKSVTFLAVPIEGTAALGYDPEEESLLLFEIVDIKWHKFYDVSQIDVKTKEVVEPFLKIIESDTFTKRAGTLVYKKEQNNVYYLLVSASSQGDLFILPQGHIDLGETNKEAAQRETEEEAGVQCKIETDLGFYLHEQKGRFFKTDIFAASYCGQIQAVEARIKKWVTLKEAREMNILRDTLLLMEKLEGLLHSKGPIE